MGRLADKKIIFNLNTLCSGAVYFFNQRLRVYYHAIANNTNLAMVKHARGYQMKDVLFILYYYGMSCIMSALITDNHIRILCKDVNYLSLALVAPLCADYNYIRQFSFSLCTQKNRVACHPIDGIFYYLYCLFVKKKPNRGHYPEIFNQELRNFLKKNQLL